MSSSEAQVKDGIIHPSSTEEEVQQWFRSASFSISVQEEYQQYEGSDILSLTLEDHKELVGDEAGSRIFELLAESLTFAFSPPAGFLT